MEMFWESVHQALKMRRGEEMNAWDQLKKTPKTQTKGNKKAVINTVVNWRLTPSSFILATAPWISWTLAKVEMKMCINPE